MRQNAIRIRAYDFNECFICRVADNVAFRLRGFRLEKICEGGKVIPAFLDELSQLLAVLVFMDLEGFDLERVSSHRGLMIGASRCFQTLQGPQRLVQSG